MTDLLGYLLWWKVAMNVDIGHDTVSTLLKGTGATLPSRPIPVDVFRRLTTDLKKTYPLDGDRSLEMSLAPVDSHNDSMMLRHLVGTVRNSGNVVVWVGKVGDAAFYKPPRGQHSKARLRVLANASSYTDQGEDFANLIRAEYQRGVRGALDSQAIRRVVRSCLAHHKAVYLDGPYFTENGIQCEALGPLFDALGKDSFMHTVPLVDTPAQRAFLTEHSRPVAP